VRSALLFSALVVLPACATPPPAAPKAAAGPIAELEAELRERPDDGAVLYALAMLNDRAGKAEEALAWLGRLAATSWDAGVDPADFLASRASAPERFAALRSSLDGKARTVKSAEAWVRIAQRDLLPEGIALDPITGDYLVSSERKRKIVRVSRDGAVRDFVPDAKDGLLGTLGIGVDARRGVVWVASVTLPAMEDTKDAPPDTSRLHAFDLATGALRARYELHGTTLLNDVAVLPDGRAVVTDSSASELYVTGAKELERLVPAGSVVEPNGIALSPDGARLYVATWRGIQVVDWKARATTPLALPAGTTSLAGIDGLYVHGGALLGIQNAVGRPRVVRIPLAPDGRSGARVDVLESGSPIVDNPTTGVIEGDAFVFLAQRNREASFRPNGPAGPLGDVVLARVKLPSE
jgi:sugar lactone lactonase YvrE